MLNEFRDWAEQVLTGYQFAMGEWVESGVNDTNKYCVIQAAGGPAVDVDDRRPRVRVVFIGRRNQRQDGAQCMDDANLLIAHALSGSRPCGAAHIRATSEPSGPGFTSENRAWVSVDFQLAI